MSRTIIVVAYTGISCPKRPFFEGFEELRSDLQKERDAMTRSWKMREAQLTRMTTGMLSMVGDLQGIGQGVVGQLGDIAVLPGLGIGEVSEA